MAAVEEGCRQTRINAVSESLRYRSFLRDSSVPLEKNTHLKAHGLTVFKLVGDAAYELGEKGKLVTLRANLLELGPPHYTYGILSEHFDVVKYALLQTIQEGLPNPEMWSPELKGAWAQAYDEVVATIKGAMEAVRAKATAAQEQKEESHSYEL